MNRTPRRHCITAWIACCVALILPSLGAQGCFLAAVPVAAEVETVGSDVAPTGAWDLFSALMGKPSPVQLQATKLAVQTRREQIKAHAAEEKRIASERAATIGILKDLWEWQHDPAIGDLLVYVKAGGDPRVAMQAAVERTRWDRGSSALCQAEPDAKPVAQSFPVPGSNRTD